MRPAAVGDVAALASLQRREHLLDGHGDVLASRRALRREHERRLVDPRSRTLVATVLDFDRREHLLGFLCADDVLSAPAVAPRQPGRSVAHLADLVVRRDVRRCGVATQLLGNFAVRLAAAGVRVAEADLAISDEVADGLFGRLGWRRADVGPLRSGQPRRVCLDVTAGPANASEVPV